MPNKYVIQYYFYDSNDGKEFYRHILAYTAADAVTQLITEQFDPKRIRIKEVRPWVEGRDADWYSLFMPSQNSRVEKNVK